MPWLLVALASLGVAACGQSPSATAPAAGASESTDAAWRGVYQGSYHLYLRLRVQDSKTMGYWRAIGNRAGRLAGVIHGDRLDFAWREQGGGEAAWAGRGYFEWHAAHGDAPPSISGEWGLGASRSGGGAWWAFKRPDSPSIDGVEDTGRDRDDDRDCPSCGIVEYDDFER